MDHRINNSQVGRAALAPTSQSPVQETRVRPAQGLPVAPLQSVRQHRAACVEKFQKALSADVRAGLSQWVDSNLGETLRSGHNAAMLNAAAIYKELKTTEVERSTAPTVAAQANKLSAAADLITGMNAAKTAFEFAQQAKGGTAAQRWQAAQGFQATAQMLHGLARKADLGPKGPFGAQGAGLKTVLSKMALLAGHEGRVLERSVQAQASPASRDLLAARKEITEALKWSSERLSSAKAQGDQPAVDAERRTQQVLQQALGQMGAVIQQALERPGAAGAPPASGVSLTVQEAREQLQQSIQRNQALLVKNSISIVGSPRAATVIENNLRALNQQLSQLDTLAAAGGAEGARGAGQLRVVLRPSLAQTQGAQAQAPGGRSSRISRFNLPARIMRFFRQNQTTLAGAQGQEFRAPAGLDHRYAVAAHLKGVFQAAGLRGELLPSREALRERLGQKVDAMASRPAAAQPTARGTSAAQAKSPPRAPAREPGRSAPASTGKTEASRALPQSVGRSPQMRSEAEIDRVLTQLAQEVNAELEDSEQNLKAEFGKVQQQAQRLEDKLDQVSDAFNQALSVPDDDDEDVAQVYQELGLRSPSVRPGPGEVEDDFTFQVNLALAGQVEDLLKEAEQK